jgi:hypothetical protein
MKYNEREKALREAKSARKYYTLKVVPPLEPEKLDLLVKTLTEKCEFSAVGVSPRRQEKDSKGETYEYSKILFRDESKPTVPIEKTNIRDGYMNTPKEPAETGPQRPVGLRKTFKHSKAETYSRPDGDI